ncbi:MFS transporter [Bradyrhizobium ivorense]|uniref:MFS transporter n=1 Tax=Bradyrhizobium ivorense TaxID=2511166 RepID=UPI0010B853D6|nr:MFS transporter [Bradyrhizobium ivorense]VIO74077.1 Inner membrane transport protein YdhP [Bradyrhizobium ivorense]
MSRQLNQQRQEPRSRPLQPQLRTASVAAAPRVTQDNSARTFHPGIVHLALAMGGFAIGIAEFATMSLLPFFAHDLGVSEPAAGHAISAYALGVVVGAPVIAVLSARLTRRTLLIALMGFFALMNGLSGLAPDYHTLLALRFLAGLPHGAYFGIAMLVAAALVPTDKRTAAVGRVLLGLTIATTVGVPLANGVGQAIGWRWAFAIVAGLALLTATLVAIFAPRDVVNSKASPLRELSALGRKHVWLTLAIGAVGFGGLFSVYTYLASTMLAVTHTSPAMVPVALCVFGVGLTAGNIIVPRFADRALMATAGGLLLWSAATLALYPLAAANIWTLCADVFLIGLGGALATVLQTRLMDVAGEAQSLAASLNHSAFNTANALGPWLGGMAVAAGYGWTSTGLVGAGLALSGFVVWAIAAALAAREGV